MKKKLSPEEMNDETKRKQVEKDIDQFKSDFTTTFNVKYMNLVMFCVRKWTENANQPVYEVRNQSLLANLRKLFTYLQEYSDKLKKKNRKHWTGKPSI